MTEIKLNLSLFLEKEMKAQKISLSKMASDLTIPKTVLHSWINNVPPTLNDKNLKYLEKIAQYFDTSVSKLILSQKDDEPITETLFESTFRDGQHRYRLRIQKIKE